MPKDICELTPLPESSSAAISEPSEVYSASAASPADVSVSKSMYLFAPSTAPPAGIVKQYHFTPLATKAVVSEAKVLSAPRATVWQGGATAWMSPRVANARLKVHQFVPPAAVTFLM